MKENNCASYGSLMVEMRRILPAIAQYLQWKHIIQDESHDADRLQWSIVENLRDLLGASLFIVADENQAIYSFRGSYPEYIMEHQAEFDVFPLINNYRSCPEIIEAANKLISHNANRIPREMRAVRTDEGFLSIPNNQDSAAVARNIHETLLSRRHEPSEICVLARNHFLLDKLAAVLDAAGVEYTQIGRQAKLMDTPLFRVFHAFLKLLVNPFDCFSFLLIRELLGVTRQQYNEIRLKATQESRSHFQVWQSLAPGDDRFFTWFEAVPDWAFAVTVENLAALFVEHGTNPEDLKPIVDFIAADNNPGYMCADYLEWLATWNVQDEVKDDDLKMKLQTIHSAKGLEFPLVIIIGCNEGILPSKQAIDSEFLDNIEAERRLMYVAATRARDALIVAVRPERKEAENGKVYENPESRFVKEVRP